MSDSDTPYDLFTKLQLQDATERYRFDLEFEHSQTTRSPPPFAARNFTEAVATLVALLVLNDRQPEAASVEEQSLLILDSADFRDRLLAANRGILPD